MDQIKPLKLSNLLNLKKAAIELGIAPQTLKKIALSGELAHYKINGKMRFAMTDLTSYVESSRYEKQVEQTNIFNTESE